MRPPGGIVQRSRRRWLTEKLVQLHNGGIGADTLDGLKGRNAFLEDLLVGRRFVLSHGVSMGRQVKGGLVEAPWLLR